MSKSRLINTEEIQNYIKDIRKIKVITHERQDEIFKELKREDITSRTRNNLLEELVIGNLRFVITVAKLYQNQGLDMVDLISEGNIGLIKATERFNPSSGFKFISYAVWWVKQSIMASLNDNARTIRLPSNVIQESQKKHRKSPKDHNESVTNYADFGYEYDLPHCINLFDEINEDGDQLIDVIINKNADNPEDILNSSDEIKIKVSIMLSILDEREKTIIEKSYGLLGVEMNLEDLGEEFGCTKERIRQLRDRALKKLRNDSYELLKYL